MRFSMALKRIIDSFGGQERLASLLGVAQGTISYWVKTARVPAKWHKNLIALAEREGISIQAHELSGVSSDNTFKDAPDMPENIISDGSESFLFYSSENGNSSVQVLLGDETVWTSQKGLSEIFDIELPTINYHLKNIFLTNELDESSVIRKNRITASDGKKYEVNFYNLDAIIAVGYRVNSYKATKFRKWATNVLKEYLIKGFVLDDERLKQGNNLFNKDYFEELLERIREIRASERMFYQKITDIYSQCSIDYDRDSPITIRFYAHVQDKLHYAIHGQTSAELIQSRVDSNKPHMGLTSWKNEKRGGKIVKSDVAVGKNYLNQEELSELNHLVSMFLDSAELLAKKGTLMKMQDWEDRLSAFLEFNGYNILENFGKVQRKVAERLAYDEYEKFRVKQDKEYKSDFDKFVVDAKRKRIK